jgi:VWFA-related protein
MTRRTFAVSLALLAFLAGNAGAQEAEPTEEPPVTFPAEVEQVVVDVVVTDKKGQAITDLKQEDIEIYEDGVRQGAVSFDMFEVEVPTVEPPPAEATVAETPATTTTPVVVSRISTNTDEQQRHGRTFVIVFDDVHLSVYSTQQAKAAVAEFLKNETSRGDRVTLVAPGSGSWWTTTMPDGLDELMEVLQKQEALLFPDTQNDRLSDYEAMRIHLFRDNQIINRVHRRYATFQVQTFTQLDRHQQDLMADEDPYVNAKAAETYYAATARNHVTLGAIVRALNSLVRIQGRKSMILVSEGFIYDTHLREFKDVLTASRRANTAIYYLNARALQAIPMIMDAEFSQLPSQEDQGFAFAQEYEMSEGSVSIASDTGGFTVRNENDLASGLKRIADETRAYYLIGYNPTNTARDGKFREIKVKLPNRKGIKIRARKGYYAPSDEDVEDESPLGTDPAFQVALDSPYDVDDIGLRMTHFVREEAFLEKARVYVAAEVNVADLEFEPQEGLDVGALQFLMVTVHRESGEYFRYDQKMDLRLPPEMRAQLSRTWLPIVRDFELVPGHYRAKIVLRDRTTGRLGTVIHDFEVPDLKRFRVSTPVLSDMRERTEDGVPGERLAIMARRDFTREGPLFCQLDVYGATRLASSGMPRVTMGYEVRRNDGMLFTNEAPTEILPTSIGALSRLIGISLESAAPGDYEIVMAIKDELSGKRVELREPFHVSEAPPPPAPTGGSLAPGSPPAASPSRQGPTAPDAAPAPAPPAQTSPSPSPTEPADTPPAPSAE